MKMDIKALRSDQIEDVNKKVEDLLWNQGITIKDTDVCTLFAEKGAKVTGEQVFIPKEMIRSAIESVPEHFTLHARNPEKTVTIGIGYDPVINSNSGMSFIQDADGTRRLACVEDQINMLKLSHGSSVIGVTNAGILYPTVDIDSENAKYVQMINALMYSDKPFFSQGADGHFGKTAIDLAKIATGYDDRCVCMSVVNSLSPMAWDSKMLGTIRAFAEAAQPINISSSSMVGATAPIFLSSTLVITVAETLAGVVYSQLLRPGTPVVFGSFSGVMDMRHMCMSYGAPEFSILCAAAAQMAAYYKMPFRGGGALTDAKVTNVQCGLESAMNMMVALNCDVHYMHQSIGTMDSILTCSAEKFIMDEEIVARINRLHRGIGEIPNDVLDSIQDGCRNGNFLALGSTAKNFRKEIFAPDFSARHTYEQWIREDDSNEKKAHQLVEKRLAEYCEPDIGKVLKNNMKEYAIRQGANL